MDEDAPHRMRWRLLGWLFAAILLLPVLYVAMCGPVAWWDANHYRTPEWLVAYDDTLKPLHGHPQIGPALGKYYIWWKGLPAPRSWQLQFLKDRLAAHRAEVEEWRNKTKGMQANAAALQLRLNFLDSRAQLTPEESGEASDLRRKLEGLQSQLDHYLRVWIPDREWNVKEAENALRAFDAAKH